MKYEYFVNPVSLDLWRICPLTDCIHCYQYNKWQHVGYTYTFGNVPRDYKSINENEIESYIMLRELGK